MTQTGSYLTPRWTSLFTYRKNKNFGELVRVSESHPLSALARSANMFTYRKNKNLDRTHA
uniref:Uncharacterized protein n=1 Tax=Candidatus Kentrum sp. TUN TaxID=2126343 RepID=A0A450ZHC9_9GAMM|nr:MAG: hypothetical protein BECKTUN1418D_GA0071000_101519 [Candidatus Kentron sp. TUN]VFK52677.1 MAG: hypothetical protein BECKTUN1418F_GA0071002_10123 [Candidatus Kentron sp. TUN]VFK53223.1 MAG: hypothetical protein BECKTUN1418E_GA0071001_10143 [Candidatus Kentron sp. TUN]